MKKITSILVCVSFISGCSSWSSDIKPQYMSPVVYEAYDCQQLGQEIQRVHSRLSSITGSQDDSALTDALAFGVGMILFWPALFFMGTDDQKEEIARLKGEYEAVEKAAISKKCSNMPIIKEMPEEKAPDSYAQKNNNPPVASAVQPSVNNQPVSLRPAQNSGQEEQYKKLLKRQEEHYSQQLQAMQMKQKMEIEKLRQQMQAQQQEPTPTRWQPHAQEMAEDTPGHYITPQEAIPYGLAATPQ